MCIHLSTLALIVYSLQKPCTIQRWWTYPFICPHLVEYSRLRIFSQSMFNRWVPFYSASLLPILNNNMNSIKGTLCLLPVISKLLCLQSSRYIDTLLTLQWIAAYLTFLTLLWNVQLCVSVFYVLMLHSQTGIRIFKLDLCSKIDWLDKDFYSMSNVEMEFIGLCLESRLASLGLSACNFQILNNNFTDVQNLFANELNNAKKQMVCSGFEPWHTICKAYKNPQGNGCLPWILRVMM